MRVATDQIDEVPAIAPEPRGPRLGGTDVFRGSLVILTALIIGGFVISRGLDEPAENEAATEETTGSQEVAVDNSTDGAATGETAADDATTSTATGVVANPDTTVPAAVDTTEVAPEGPAVRVPSEVKVLVLNGAQTQGIAGRGTEVLQAASYQTGAPKNANSQRPSAVLYIEGYQAEAVAVAAAFGPGLETLVQPLDPADAPIDDLQGSHVVVVIGADQLLPIS